MNDLIITRPRGSAHWQLLTTASALVLVTYVSSGSVYAVDADHPTVWIELGGQLERVNGSQETFAPPFILGTPRPPAETVSPLGFERAPLYSKGGEAAFSVSSGSGWSVSAAIRYGRSNSDKQVRQQSYPGPFVDVFYSGYQRHIYPLAAKFSDVTAHNSERHFVVDFQAGKDVGLGMFGSSTVNLGIRFAQFTGKSDIALKSNPDWHFNYFYFSYADGPHKFALGQPYHTYTARFTATRSFHGIGPSLSWKASTPLVGNPDTSQVALDWGVNAAILFGRQKTRTHHQTTAQYHAPSGFIPTEPVERTTLYQNPATPDHTRSRSPIVPNIGGFAGVSYRYSNAKISLGYRADFFFGAMDGGIDARKTYDRNFFGPYATISVGFP